jgi:hypothetical protein
MNDRLRKFLRFSLERLREPSTFAGLASVALMLHHAIPDQTVQGLSAIGAGVAGLLACFLPENK